MQRDSQRSAVYQWEHEVRDRWPECNKTMTLNECQALIRRVWDDYRPGANLPNVSDGRGRRRAGGSRWEIKLPRWARTTIVVLHETAHSLLDGDGPWHGPKFARLLLDLWGRYAGVPVRKAKKLAVDQKPRRVHFAQAADAPHPVSQEYRRWQAERRRLRLALEEHDRNRPPKHR